MASPDVLDLERLLTPIEGENPAGRDMREDDSLVPLYFQIKDARSAARAAERGAVDEEDTGSIAPEWRTIVEMAPDVLAETSKDLEIACWLTEALIRFEDFAGLRDGFRLMKGLVEGFWDNLYPPEDEIDGPEAKFAPLSGLNGEGGDGTLIQPIRQIYLTQGDTPFAAWHYRQASELAALDEARRTARVDAGAPTLEMIDTSARQTSADFFRTLSQDLNGAIEAFKELEAALDARLGMDGPPTSNIRNAMAESAEIIERLTRDILMETPEDDAGTSEGDGADGEDQDGGTITVTRRAGAAMDVIETRDDALKQLLKIADFFKRTEPHSPIAYTLEDLVRRGRMTLPDLLSELISDDEARSGFLMRAGIRPPPPPEE